MRNNERPKPGDFHEIARGSGSAAILLFLHIAVTGYLGFIAWYLIKHNSDAFWNLLPFSAALYYYFPAAFAILTPIPTDNLTRIVGRVARTMGIIAVLIFCAGLIQLALGGESNGYMQWIAAGCAMMAGLAGALLCRVVFAVGIRGEEGFLRKNH